MNSFPRERCRGKAELYFENDQQILARGGRSGRYQRWTWWKLVLPKRLAKTHFEPTRWLSIFRYKTLGARKMHGNAERCGLSSDVASDYDVIDLSQAKVRAWRKRTLMFRSRSGFDTRADSNQLGSKFNATELKAEKLWLGLLQKELGPERPQVSQQRWGSK